MSMVRVIAIDGVNGHAPGADWEVTEREANQLLAKGLVKMAGPVENKMAAPVANKSNPSPAAGEVQRSSASPAARASAKKTATRSVAGKTSTRARAASSR